MSLEKKTVLCKNCNHNIVLLGTQRPCPYCGEILRVPPAVVVPRPAAVAPTMAPAMASPAVPPQPVKPGESFPENMKANRVLAGRLCMGCQQAIEIGDDVWNCPACQQTMHRNCRQAAGACRNQACPTALQLVAPVLDTAPAGVAAAPSGEALVECKVCGEKILAKAKKCRFCGEYQNSAQRLREARQQASVAADENLSGWEIAFGILCSGIACIMAIVWMIQGKKKGPKLLAIAVVSAIVINVLKAAVRH